MGREELIPAEDGIAAAAKVAAVWIRGNFLFDR
jgi:hypothetical protein